MGFSDQPSPVAVLPAQQHFNTHQTRPMFTSPFSNTNGADSSFGATPNFTPSSTAPPSAAGRKRSRDEASANLDEEYFPIQVPVKEPEDENEWVYGEGMVLIKPNKGYISDAATQTGTWQEEQAKAEEEALKAAIAAQQDRPVIRATKSMRLDMTATPTISEEVGLHSAVSAPSPERSAYVEPAVDEFTRHLGIGWSKISSDPDIQAAARGWTKYIENHYPVHNASIRLQSRGLASYLVEADEGFFLFHEDLRKGQLVSTTLEKTWQNLSSAVPVFDGETVLEAIESPKMVAIAPVAQTSFAIDGAATTNGIQAPHQALEVEMDMS